MKSRASYADRVTEDKYAYRSTRRYGWTIRTISIRLLRYVDEINDESRVSSNIEYILPLFLWDPKKSKHKNEKQISLELDC